MDIRIVIIILIITFLILYVREHNIIKRLYNKVLQSKSGIDVALNKRFDLIPNLVECVKGYAKHEQKIFEIIIKQRNEYYHTNRLSDAVEVNKYCDKILALKEKYPDLKSSEQFISLQYSLAQIENQLQAARRLYNSDVTVFNTKISTFPGNIFAVLMGMEKQELFEFEK